jgi:alpha-glucosidase (family GH31 glycosyl hydrolase)
MSINRMYLQLKSALTPYQYSYSQLATETGMPPIRAMALQFPDDISTYNNHTGTAFQFMSGDWLLVAPVYRNESTRVVSGTIAVQKVCAHAFHTLCIDFHTYEHARF